LSYSSSGQWLLVKGERRMADLSLLPPLLGSARSIFRAALDPEATRFSSDYAGHGYITYIASLPVRSTGQ